MLINVLVGDGRPDLSEIDAEVRYVRASELWSALPTGEILLIWDFLSTALPSAWPEKGGPSWVHVASAGVDRFVFRELIEADPVLTNSRGVFDEPIAEYVLGLVLAFAKRFPETLELQRHGEWRHREPARVAGQRAVIVGSGPIGQAIARLLSAVGVDAQVAGRSTPWRDQLPGIDHLIVAAPLTDTTRDMFDKSVFERLPDGAVFINVGRGELVVEEDLIAAAPRLRGVGLDVFREEPLPADSPFWTMKNVIVSPHMSGDVVGWREELRSLFVENYRRYRDGRPLLNVVDKRRIVT